ncbi:MAG: GIY-YIG nuclease family protein [Terracidiphilus sp.]
MAQTKRSKAIPADEDHSDDGQLSEDDEEGRGPAQTRIVKKFIRMPPRAIFDTQEVGRLGSIARNIKELTENPGVYILYRDDVPFYVGKAEKSLFNRLHDHANGVSSNRSYFWNYFSAYILKDRHYIADLEAILISAMPSVIMNSSRPNLDKMRKGKSTIKLMREMRKRTGRY